MTGPKYSHSAVRTLAAAMGTDPNAHDFVITDTATGHVKGVYTTERLAAEALARLPHGVFVLTILHPQRCDCLGVPA